MMICCTALAQRTYWPRSSHICVVITLLLQQPCTMYICNKPPSAGTSNSKRHTVRQREDARNSHQLQYMQVHHSAEAHQQPNGTDCCTSNDRRHDAVPVTSIKAINCNSGVTSSHFLSHMPSRNSQPADTTNDASNRYVSRLVLGYADGEVESSESKAERAVLGKQACMSTAKLHHAPQALHDTKQPPCVAACSHTGGIYTAGCLRLVWI